MADPRDYNVVISRVVEDGETLFRATVKELPDVAEYAETGEEAYGLALDAIATLKELSAELGHDFPVPVARPERSYSGRITLRTAKSLHQMLAEFAEEDGVSLNQFIVDKLSQAVGISTFVRAGRTVDIVKQFTSEPISEGKVASSDIVFREWSDVENEIFASAQTDYSPSDVKVVN